MKTTQTSTLAERLNNAMKARNLKQRQLSELVTELSGAPISQVAIQKITSGKTQHSKRITDIARALNVSAEWLAHGSSPFPPDGTTLSSDGFENGAGENTDREERKIRWGTVPVVGTAQLGDDGYFEDEGYPVGHGSGVLRIQSSDPDAYGLRLLGDSMQPRIMHGEFVLVEPNTPPVLYEEVLVKTVDGKKMIKIFAQLADGFYRFDSINHDHPPIHLRVDQVESVHYVAGILKKSRFFEA